VAAIAGRLFDFFNKQEKKQSMNKLFVLIILSLTLGLMGCNTWHGFGKDLEQVGVRIQRSPNNK